jgi:chromosome segregation ATPase
MKLVEPSFEPASEFWPAPTDAAERDIGALENTIARQSSELNLRLTEVLELYATQGRQADELEAAQEEINRLQKTIVRLQSAVMQQRVEIVSAQDKIACLKNDKAAIAKQLDQAHQEIKTLTDRNAAIQLALDARETNAASALAQIDYLNSELVAATAERFKLVATVFGQKRRHDRQVSRVRNASGAG